MNPEKIEKIVKTIDKMPSLSPTVGKIVEIANDPTSSPKDLNKVISMDPILTARVLKLVNSAYFGLSTKVTNILRAIILLGLTTIKNLALSTAILSKFQKKKIHSGFNTHEFWKHSLGVAVISKLIAKKRGIPEKELEEFFIAGLLHDIGKIVLEEFFTEDLKKIMNLKTANGCSFLEAEEKIIGVNHSEIGKWLGEKWIFTPALVEAIFYHHTPELAEVNKELTATVFLANSITKAHFVGDSGNDFLESATEEILEILELKEEEIWSLEFQIHEAIEKASSFLKISETT